MKTVFLLASALFSISAAEPERAREAAATGLYDVTVKIAVDGEPIGAPHFRMRAGSAATLTKAGAGGFALEAVVNPVGADPDSDGERRVSLAMDLRLEEGGRLIPSGRPFVQVGLGRPATMSLAPAEGRKVTLEMVVDEAGAARAIG